MRKIRSIALVTAIAVGGLAVAATNPLDIGSATGTVTPTAPAPGDGSQAARPAGKALDQALSGLVAKGTITESQAAAVKSAIRDEVKKVEAAHPRRRVVRGARRLVVHASAKAIGIPDADLVKALRGGSSIADVANAKGVPVTKVIDAIVTAGRARLDTAVKAGKLSAEQAAKAEQRLPQLAERAVNRTHK